MYSQIATPVDSDINPKSVRTSMTKADGETTDEGSLIALFEVPGFPLP